MKQEFNDFNPEEDSPVAVTFQRADEKTENVLRPQYLEDFQGQAQLKENLSVFIKAARERGEALDHTFLIGPPPRLRIPPEFFLRPRSCPPRQQ